MIETIIEFSRYLAALLFGTAVAVRFAGIGRTKKITWRLGVLPLFYSFCKS